MMSIAILFRFLLSNFSLHIFYQSITSEEFVLRWYEAEV